MPQIDFAEALRRARGADPAAVPEILGAVAADFGGADVVVYLVDFGQTVLEPLPDRSTHADAPSAEPVGASMAGRAFVDQRVVAAERDEGVRVWAPILEASDRTGVIAVTLPVADESLLVACEDLGLLAGYLIAAVARCTDLYNLYRRRRSMSLAASMQWDQLPPMVLKAGAVCVAGHIEPAYDVGGDCFDYATNGAVFDFAIMDAMGHGLFSAGVSGLAMGVYRHGRREGQTLPSIHTSLARTISDQHAGATFVTGLLGRIDTHTGVLSWTNAGHPQPLLMRHGRVIGELHSEPTVPWGVGVGDQPAVATESLEPGDCVLVYTDGVIEARTPDGEEFGLDRLIDITQQNASEAFEPQEVVRRLVNSVLEHQRSPLADDATVVLMRWDGRSSP